MRPNLCLTPQSSIARQNITDATDHWYHSEHYCGAPIANRAFLENNQSEYRAYYVIGIDCVPVQFGIQVDSPSRGVLDQCTPAVALPDNVN